MKRQNALNMLQGLAQQAENRLRDWGIDDVGVRIIECPHNSESLHVDLVDEDGVSLIQYHVWDPGDDFSESDYEPAFMFMCQEVLIVTGIIRSIRQSLSERANPFNKVKAYPPYHGGLLN